MMDKIRKFRDNPPLITDEARDAARAQLLHAMREPALTVRRQRRPRLAWRLVLATSLAVATVVGFTVTRDADQPVIVPIANVGELGERAARAAETDPDAIVLSPGKWLYTKETIAPLLKEPRPEVDMEQRITLERWNSADGKQTALDDGTGRLVHHETGPGITATDLAEAPVTPEEMLTRMRAALSGKPVTPAADESDGTMEERLFQTIHQLMSGQPLVPEVRAALFRALPMIKGVSVKQDAVDATGRHGNAFVYTGAWQRSEIIISPEDYRFLGTYGETVTDRTFFSERVGTVKAGTPTVWTAYLESQVVDRPGDRP
ncbi:CU044_5270 family protein [Streptosporangium minutum]|nr:CU044_5270 family protein [Streptosporangium minutum]